MENNNLANEQEVSQPVEEVSVVDYPNGESVTTDQDALLNAYFNDPDGMMDLSASAPSEVPVEEVEEASAEELEETETVSEESAVEDIEQDEEDEEYSPPEGEANIIDLSELEENDYFPYTNSEGKVEELNWPEIHNRLRRAESASNKSREAKAQIDEYKAMNEELQAEREYFRNRRESEALHPELQQAMANEQAMWQQVEEAHANGSLDFANIKYGAERATAHRQQLQQNYEAAKQQAGLQEAQKSRAILRQRGLGYLFDDETKQTEFLNFVSEYPPEVQEMIRTNPDFTQMAVDSLALKKATKNKKPVVKSNTRRAIKKGRKTAPVKQGNHDNNANHTVPTRDNYLGQDDMNILDAYMKSR